ncbi:hypothetical protein KHQ81_04225 [Mycoplasmatota bacterium]|nr:hypothetical protein KHQ81_04225 [Mycoplasmatota bacterium]
MKKYALISMMLIVSIMIAGCDMLNDTNEKFVDVNYEDMDTVYSKTYYDMLPKSLHNDTVVNEYQETNIIDLVNNVVDEIDEGDITGDYEDMLPEMPNIDFLEPSEMTSSELSEITFDTLHDNVGSIGPVDMVYSNLASVQYLLQLLERMNEEFEKYGEIEFDGTEITIPSSEFPEVTDPLTGENYQFDDITAKYTQKDKVSNILVHTVNDYSYEENEVKFNGELGLYLKVSISMNKDHETTISIDFYVTCDLSAEAQFTNPNSKDSGSIQYKIGQSVKAIENKSIVVNSEVQTNINLDLVDNDALSYNIPDINESISINTSFVLEKNKDGIISDFKVVTNIFDNAEFNYHLAADDNGSTLYFDGNISDEDFFGENIPAQDFKAIFVYDSNSEILFIGVDTALNIPEYDIWDNYTGTRPLNYAGYAWNLNAMTGWTDVKKSTEQAYEDYYILLNGDTVVLPAEEQQVTFDNDDLIEAKGIVAGEATLEDTSLGCVFYLHLKQGDSIDIDLPEGLTSTNYEEINDLFSNMSSIKDEMIIDFDNEKYQVPELQKDLFE